MADNRKIYKEALQIFGHAAQIEKAVEECGELIVELQRYKQARKCDVQSEIADVEIMCAQMRIVFPGVPAKKAEKLARLQALIKTKKESVE